MRQFLAVEHRQALAGIEHERNAGRVELLGVLQHRFAAVRGDDAEPDVVARRAPRDVRLLHRARMEGRDLVVVTVVHDHGLRGEAVVDLPHELGTDAQRAQPLQIVAAVAADRRHRQRLAAERVEAVGDVARAPAEVAPQGRHQERHIEDVQLLGKDLVGESTLESHDGVEREGAANHCCHG